MMRNEPTVSFDWATIIDQLVTAGLSREDINGGMLTDKMLAHYRKGVQPLHWRGERIILLWCKTTGLPRDQAPTKEVIRGHRVDRRLIPGPRLQALPQWPPVVQVPQPAVKMRKKPGPKPKARVAA